MKTFFTKIYTLIPLVLVVFFFQNCEKKLGHDSAQNSSYEGISDVNSTKLSK